MYNIEVRFTTCKYTHDYQSPIFQLSVNLLSAIAVIAIAIVHDMGIIFFPIGCHVNFDWLHFAAQLITKMAPKMWHEAKHL